MASDLVDPHFARIGVEVDHPDLRGRVALAIGGEGTGLSQALLAKANRRLTIPMAPDCESLNAAAAAAVVLFECVRQRANAPP